MNGWVTVLVAAGAAYALKVSGYLVPVHLLDGPVVSRMVRLLPVALLSALVAVQAFTSDGALALDARLAALGVAIVLLTLRAPFLVVVVAAAATAALLRLAGVT